LGEYDDETVKVLRGTYPFLTVDETDPITNLRLVDMSQMIQED
jgi:hypothetical protein